MAINKSPTLLQDGAGAIAIATHIVLSPFTRRWYGSWNATAAEKEMALPGDELAQQPTLVTMRAITINAGSESIWPWLVQIGHGRGGLYSYERLENLAGCDIHNATELLPAHQLLAVGDAVRLGPPGKNFPAFTVVELTPPVSLVLRGGEPGMPDNPSLIYIWSFYLHELGQDRTRLLVRSRLTYPPNIVNRLMWRGFVDPVAFVMERQMLRGLKARVEASSPA